MVYQTYGGTNNSPNSMSSGDQNRKIFLGGLSYQTTDETLRAFCSRYGKITDCLVMRNPEGKSRGFGFVTYEDTSSVEEFMRSRPHTIDTRQIDPKRAMPREEQNSSEAHLTVKKLFIAGLREGINEDSLRQYFSRYGNVVEALVMKDRDGKPRGFAFVTFDDYDAVDKAVLEKPHLINGRTLDVKKAVPKEKMQEESGTSSSPGGSGMPSFNRNNLSNYAGSSSGPPSTPPSRNNFGPVRDNFNNPSGSWDNQGGMARMNNQNQSYNQPQTSSYGQQGGYNASATGFNAPMPPTGGYQQEYNSMGQNQPPPPLPPPQIPQQQQPMMNYDMYSKTSNMPFNNIPNQQSNSSYMQPPPPSYAQNPQQQQQQGFGGNPNSFGGMNNPFNLPQAPSVATGGYNDISSATTSYDNSSSYGITSQNYGGGGGGGGGGGYNNMPQQQSRGGGPMRGGRGGGGSYGGPSGGDGGYGNRSAPYSTRGGRGGGSSNYSGRGRGRGRGQ